MLTRFLYLDSIALAQYLSSLEGGSLTGSTQRSTRAGSAEGGADLKVAHGKGARSHEEAQERTLVDTDGARFERLLGAAAKDPERLGWTEVTDPDTDFEGIGIGAMVTWECDLYVPETVKMLSKAGGALPVLEMMRKVLPAASALGLNTHGVPGGDQIDAMTSFFEGIESKALIVGEDDATDWQVAGNLTGQPDLADLEGRARVVGKVARILKPGQWKPFMTFPGMDLLSREERRRAERTAPAPGKEDDYLHGPALILDVLAIYR